MALAAIRSRLAALEAAVVLVGVLLREDVVEEAEGWRQQLGGRSERLVYRESCGDVEGRRDSPCGRWREQKDGVINWTARRRNRGNGEVDVGAEEEDEVDAVDAVEVLVEVGVAVAVEELASVGKAGAVVDAGGERVGNRRHPLGRREAISPMRSQKTRRTGT